MKNLHIIFILIAAAFVDLFIITRLFEMLSAPSDTSFYLAFLFLFFLGYGNYELINFSIKTIHNNNKPKPPQS